MGLFSSKQEEEDARPVLIRDRVLTSIDLGESHFREFKSAQEGSPFEKRPRPNKEIAKDICSTLVGFANADGGTLLVGVEDDGEITGLIDYTEKTVQYLTKCWKDGVHSSTPLRGVQTHVLAFIPFAYVNRVLGL
jgi:ATP-dependent DNA helicase RecG